MNNTSIRNFNNVTSIYKPKKFKVALQMTSKPLNIDSTTLETIGMSHDLSKVLQPIFEGLDDDQEHLVLLIINVGGDLSGFKVISSGGQASLSLDCKVLFRNALLLGAHSIIIAHNHPSGQVEPSQDDIDITRKIARAGEAININLLDHIIYSPTKIYSLRQEKLELFQIEGDL